MNDAPGRDSSNSGLSRRAFLRGSGLTAATAALTGSATALAETADADEKKADAVGMGPGPVALTLNVNGKKLETKTEPRVTLLDALRNYLNVTGCKRVCDRGSCGACTVLVDDKPIYSCTMLAVEAEGKKIATAESLVEGDKIARVPAAFSAADAQQCGFCTPGFDVSMHAVLKAKPNATPAEVEDGLCGNICRCGTYEQMRDAIASLCNTKRKEG